MSALQSPVPTTLAKCELRTPLYVHLLQPGKTKGPVSRQALSLLSDTVLCPHSSQRAKGAVRYGYGLLTRKKSAPLLIG